MDRKTDQPRAAWAVGNHIGALRNCAGCAAPRDESDGSGARPLGI